MMETEFLIFFVLRLSVVICGFMVGKKVYPTTKHYLWRVFPFIIAFALNEGLRFGRGIDYNGYYFKYHSILAGDTGSRVISDPVFVALCNINNYLGFPYQGLIVALSLILVVSGCVLLKDNKEVLLYAFPLFFLISSPAENLIRWYLAFSFLMIFAYYYNKGELGVSIIFLLLALGSHLAIALIAVIMVCIKFIKKPILNPVISIILYLVLWLLFSTDMMLGLAKYINSIGFLSDYYSGYINNADIWLTGSGTGGHQSQNFGIGLALPDVLTIYLAYKVVKKHPQTTYYANIYIIGAILGAALMRIELGYRITIVLKLFQCILLAYAFKDYLFTLKRSELPMKLAVWIILLNIIRIYFIFIFTGFEIENVLYVWDSNGRNVL